MLEWVTGDWPVRGTPKVKLSGSNDVVDPGKGLPSFPEAHGAAVDRCLFWGASHSSRCPPSRPSRLQAVDSSLPPEEPRRHTLP